MDKYTVRIRPEKEGIYAGGYHFRPVEGGGYLLVGAHGDENGGLWAENVRYMAVIRADDVERWAPGRVVAMPCYPTRVQERYPNIDVRGDWAGETLVTYVDDHTVQCAPGGDSVQ